MDGWSARATQKVDECSIMLAELESLLLAMAFGDDQESDNAGRRFGEQERGLDVARNAAYVLAAAEIQLRREFEALENF